VIIGCGEEDNTTTSMSNQNENIVTVEPTATPIPEPTATPIPEPTPTTNDPSEAKSLETNTNYPVTITDKLNQNINITNKPEKIVSISPTATEMIYKIGGEIIARDRASVYPLSVMKHPSIGSAYSPNIELIVEQGPDLVVMEALTQARFVGEFQKLGIPTIAVRAESLIDVTESMNILGSALDLEENSEKAISEINQKIDSLKTSVNYTEEILILISDADRNVYAAKPESYAGAVAELFDLNNGAKGMEDMGPYPGYTLWTAEKAATSNPGFIFTISPAPEPAPKLSGMLPMIPGFNRLTAVTTGNVAELDPVLFMQAPGPRMAEAAELIESILNEK
jgi:iron complex transport system substrate-binding protein|tara:strand:+ start:1316 stop:2329 length:1014 start_codon:yes stop_codon:yes gene_type:complete